MSARTESHGRKAPDADKRKPVKFLNYPGDVVSGFNPLEPMGPTDNPNLLPTMGRGDELLWPVVSEYDPETNRTRVGLSYIAPGQVSA